METNAIIVELLSRIKVLESKVEDLERKIGAVPIVGESVNRPSFPADLISDKYKGLAEYLYEKWEKKITLTYAQIEEKLGFSLPSTAHNYPQSYWANTKTHSYASAWMALGYKAKVNEGNNSVNFERSMY